MDWREQITAWIGLAGRIRWTNLGRQIEWRPLGTAAGSVAAHVLLAMAVGAMMAAASANRHKPAAPAPLLEVTLVAETPVPSLTPAPLRSPATSAPDSVPVPKRRVEKEPEKKKGPAGATVPGAAAAEDDSVFLGSTGRSNAPAGLQGLLESDPCEPRYGVKQKDCASGWSEKLGDVDTLRSAPKEELAKYYGDFMPICRWRVGCEGGEWISNNGTRSVFGSAMAGGAGGFRTGAESTVGRLPQKPDHIDPGFGD